MQFNTIILEHSMGSCTYRKHFKHCQITNKKKEKQKQSTNEKEQQTAKAKAKMTIAKRSTNPTHCQLRYI